MPRPSKKITLKDGYYLAIRSSSNSHQSQILVRRNTKKEIDNLLSSYSKTKNAVYYGKVEDNKVVSN